MERNSELKSLIQQMEAQYDAQPDSEGSEANAEAPKVNLSPEIEEFLSELGETVDDQE